MAQALALADRFKGLKELPGLKADACGVQRMTGDVGERVAIVAARDVRDKEVRRFGEIMQTALAANETGRPSLGASPHCPGLNPPTEAHRVPQQHPGPGLCGALRQPSPAAHSWAGQ